MTKRTRHRDLWMFHIAQVIISGKEPATYPTLDDEHTADKEEPTLQDIELEKERIQKVVNRFLPCAPGRISQVRRQILELCSRHDSEQCPYDLLICADQIMMGNNVPDKDRIANVVCERLLTIYDDVIRKRRGPDRTDRIKTTQIVFSLRRLLARLCHDANLLPRSLFQLNIHLPSDATALSAGGRGDVFRVKSSVGTPPYLALKTCRISEISSSLTPTLLVEAILALRLQHANLVQFVGLHQQTRAGFDMTFIVYPWMDNGDVENYLKINKMDLIHRIQWIHEIARGLRYLHDEFIVHGDLHAKNILVDKEMHVYITDFGQSDVMERTTTAAIVRDTSTAFTYYTAPELTEEGAKPDFPSDVWSFGCLCLLIWTGEPPYAICRTTMQLTRLFIEHPDRTPENPAEPMDTFHADEPQAQGRGAFLKSKVALPCWSREPEARPKMAHMEEILSSEPKELL